MRISTFGEIKAVAFDIDGTLYKNRDFYFKIALYFLRYNQFFLKYGLVRSELRKKDSYLDFTKAQAIAMSKKLRCSPERAKEKLDKIIYHGLGKYFAKVKVCDGVLELVQRLKENGLKIAVLSDFPPEQKGEIWGIRQYCDAIIGSEEEGGLKPSPVSFNALSQKLQIPPEEILYVGNSYKYDVMGPKKLGIKTAWFVTSKAKTKSRKAKDADFVFNDYHQLENLLFSEQK